MDEVEKYHCKSQKGKDEKFENEGMQEHSVDAGVKQVTVEIKSHGLIGNTYLGEVRSMSFYEMILISIVTHS